MPESWKTHAVGLASFLLGLVSVILSFWLLGYFGFAFTHYLTTDPNLLWGRSWRVFVFEYTRGAPLVLVIGWIGVAGLAGAVGYWLVRRASRGDRRSFAAMSARLSLGGLVGVGCDVLLLVWMFGYRAYRYLLG
jgi:hypothetical protein